MSLQIQFLPARQGDAVLLQWPSDTAETPHQMLVDLGTAETGTAFAKRLRDWPQNRRSFELLIVTHVDSDHIGGVLTGASGKAARDNKLSFGDVWFNAWPQLHGRQAMDNRPGELEPMGPAEGQVLDRWLRSQPWNQAFDRGPCVRPEQGPLPTVSLPGQLQITVLGPTQERLIQLQAEWKEAVEIALGKRRLDPAEGELEPLGPRVPPTLQTKNDLRTLAASRMVNDPSRTNASSIVVVVSWRGRRVLLTGDARADDLLAGLRRLPRAQRTFDVIKLPHHGSRNNLSTELVKGVACSYWVVSTDGTRHRHPDPEALARILQWRKPKQAMLGFNVPSTYSRWWENEQWRAKFDYDVAYGTDDDGLILKLDPIEEEP